MYFSLVIRPRANTCIYRTRANVFEISRNPQIPKNSTISDQGQRYFSLYRTRANTNFQYIGPGPTFFPWYPHPFPLKSINYLKFRLGILLVVTSDILFLFLQSFQIKLPRVIVSIQGSLEFIQDQIQNTFLLSRDNLLEFKVGHSKYNTILKNLIKNT